MTHAIFTGRANIPNMIMNIDAAFENMEEKEITESSSVYYRRINKLLFVCYIPYNIYFHYNCYTCKIIHNQKTF